RSSNLVCKEQVLQTALALRLQTIKRDYISIIPKPDGLTAAKNLAEAFEHYNEWHPHSALGYRSPREYLRQRACNGLSDNRCLEI
ncbi:integrase core domain-containing protein, partial [Escherichia coli]|uniref:integrase core domain-containing protein n=2 Tax=Escherichia coli TaxID=562 RepID=UPI002360BED2